MTKKIIECPVGKPELCKTYYGSEVIAYYEQETVYAETSIDSLIKQLKEIKKNYPQFTDLRLNSIRDCGCRFDCSCRPTLRVEGKRLETDLEYEFRLKEEAKRKEDQERRDRQQYEQLKAKFGQ